MRGNCKLTIQEIHQQLKEIGMELKDKELNGKDSKLRYIAMQGIYSAIGATLLITMDEGKL